ncbi:MAG: hypothetical protein ABL917_01260 [Parcubacteria group bacterium]
MVLIVGSVLVVIVLITLIIFICLLLKGWGVTLSGTGSIDWKNWLVVSLGIILIYVLLATFPPTSKWWIGQWATNWHYLSLGTLALVLAFGPMLPKSKTPFKMRVAYVLIPVATLYVVWFLGVGNLMADPRLPWNDSVTSTSGSNSVGGSVVSSPGITDYSFPSERKGNSDAYNSYLLWTNESVGLTLKEEYEMWMTCGTESNWKQFEDNSKTPRIGRNEDGTPNGAIGFCMIKPEFWSEKAKELHADLGKLEGNVRIAIWIRKNDPDWESKWGLLPKVRAMMAGGVSQPRLASTPSRGNGVVKVSAPLDGPGEKLSVDGKNITFDVEGPLCIFVNESDKCTKADKGARFTLPGRVNTLQFQSRGTESVTVTVTFL